MSTISSSRSESSRRRGPSLDVAVVGGGYTGLSTALELARNGVDVVVLEAEAFGYNASGRNSGGVSFGLDLAKVARWRRWSCGKGPDMAALARGAVDSLDYMESFIAQNAIDCDYHRRGRLSCAPTSHAYDDLARRAERLRAANASRLLDTMARPVVPFGHARNLWRSSMRGVGAAPIGKQKDGSPRDRSANRP